jgi:hypothetical protein
MRRKAKTFPLNTRRKTLFDGTCRITGRRYTEGQNIIYTEKGWAIDDEITAKARGIQPPQPEPEQQNADQIEDDFLDDELKKGTEISHFKAVSSNGSFNPGLVSFISFESPLELLEAARNRCQKALYDESRCTSMKKWFGSGSFEEAAYIAENGWAEGAEHIHQITERLATQIKTVDTLVPSWEYEVCGEELDVARFLSDEPECFISCDPQNREILKIYVGNCFASLVSAEQIRTFGANIAAAVQALESANYSVEVNTITQFDKDGSPRIDIVTTIKKSDAPLEIDRLAFFLVHPSAFRRMSFAIVETQSDLTAGYYNVGNRPIKADNTIFISAQDYLNPLKELRKAGLIQ